MLPAIAESNAHAAPPLPEPTIPPEPSPPPTPSPSTEPATPPTTAGAADSPYAPPPNLSKNPIDVLPPDVIYPPLDRANHPARPIIWNPEWARFGTGDWVVTSAGVVIALGSAIVPPFKKHSFGGSTGFDDSIRDKLRLNSSEARYAARDASDIALSLEATWPFFVDALITAWWYRGSPDAATQMALVDGEALAIVTAVQGATNTIASRERPYGQTCGTAELPDQTNDCQGNVRYRSFFSGHTAFSFMSAGLICVHHEKLDLLGGVGDEISCVTAYAGAAATGVFRIMGDMHFATDVLMGAGVGGLIGLAVPLFHYRRANLAPQDKPKAVNWTVVPIGTGLGVGGTF
jgi:membrane-associated phospholipid phosphatase